MKITLKIAGASLRPLDKMASLPRCDGSGCGYESRVVIDNNGGLAYWTWDAYKTSQAAEAISTAFAAGIISDAQKSGLMTRARKLGRLIAQRRAKALYGKAGEGVLAAHLKWSLEPAVARLAKAIAGAGIPAPLAANVGLSRKELLDWGYPIPADMSIPRARAAIAVAGVL